MSTKIESERNAYRLCRTVFINSISFYGELTKSQHFHIEMIVEVLDMRITLINATRITL